MTTHARRLQRAHLAVETLLRQTVFPDLVLLWIPNEIPLSQLPVPLVRQSRRGLEIREASDLGPHTKIIHALRAFPDLPIVTVDDDKLYPRDLIESLWQAYRREPQFVHCRRAHEITLDELGRPRPYRDWRLCISHPDGPSHLVFPTGVGGVLYPPRSLHPDVTDERAFAELCPTNDDVWLKAMALRNGVQSKRIPGPHREFPTVSQTTDSALWTANVRLGRNDEQLKAVFDRYDLYERLRDDAKAEDFQRR